MWSCQSAADQMKYAVKLTRLALGSMLGVLNQETFTVRSVRDLMWGYNDSLFKLAKDVMPPENVVPHDLFGLFVGVCVLPSSLHSFPPSERTVDDKRNVTFYFHRKMGRLPMVRSPFLPGSTLWPTTPPLTTGTECPNCRFGSRTSATKLSARTERLTRPTSLPTPPSIYSTPRSAAACHSSTTRTSFTME